MSNVYYSTQSFINPQNALMAPLNVNFACALYDRMVPLASGEVPTPGLNVNFVEVQHPRDIFDRMVANKEFDVSELSASEYITRHVAGDRSFVAIPVFASRVFRHSFICVNTNLVKKPEDLNGKRIGVQLYHMTAAVYIRGILQHEYGVDLSTIEWVQGKMETPGSHGQPAVLSLLKPVNITNNTDPTKSLSDLLESGEVAATIGADIPACLNRVPHVQRLFPNFKDVESDYYKRTGIFPIMHLVAFRREFYEANKFVASALFNVLEESKEIARKRMESLGALRYMLPWLGRDLVEIQETFGGDCWPYGLEENRKTLEAVVQFLYEQNMIERTVPIEELFAPVRRINFRIG